ncbi:MAG TPA: diacylglycerol kinase family protein [Phycisphaerales bacterium]|nr:diacylglycerol kinase family protein [Phycisphaerales bacterium]
MRITILYNPISGRGAAEASAQAASTALVQAGHDVELEQTRRDEWTGNGEVDPWTARDLVVIAGGDGAMRGAARRAAEAGVAVYHLPMGTENLFAREFGMRRDAAQLVQAVSEWRIETVDMGEANGLTFLLMASVGLDANVVHDLAANRKSAISHWTYLGPVARQLISWRSGILRVETDGRAVVDGLKGMVVIANAKQYGWRLDPAREADMTDGLLDVVFLPARSGVGVARWVVRCKTGRQMKCKGAVHARGEHVRVTSETPFLFQLDGDPPPPMKGKEDGIGTAKRVNVLDARVRRGSLRVLRPRGEVGTLSG